jgi:putative OPT family oligopeptide transporter
VCNDLKTGYLVGASPRYQQMIQILGVIAGAFVLAPVMTILHEGSLREHADGTGGIGGTDLPAPQAALFAALARGFFGDQPLPQDMLLWGVGIGVALLVADLLLERSQVGFRLHVMPVAVGLYLPFSLAVPILLGGITAWLVSRRAIASDPAARRGVLLSSGVIAGESLVGVLLGLLFYLGYRSLGVAGQLSGRLASPTTVGAIIDLLSVAALASVAVWIYRASRKKLTTI